MYISLATQSVMQEHTFLYFTCVLLPDVVWV